MFKLPLDFDLNEWFVLISMIGSMIVFVKVPNRMPKGMALAILLYFAFLGLTTDILIGVDYPFNFYKIMDSPKLELFDVIIYAVNYSLYGYFFAYFIYKWKKRKVLLLFFILYWVVQTTVIEWIAVQVHVFTYNNGWNTGFSALSYLFIYTLSAGVTLLFSHSWKSND